jgi:penicillin-binding protein 1A
MRNRLLVLAIGLPGLLALVAPLFALVWLHRTVGPYDQIPELDLSGGAESTVVLDRSGRRLFVFFEEQRTSVPLDRMSPHLIAAVLSIEDQRFRWHHGVDPVRVVGAALANVRAGRLVEGASTITQQLVRLTTHARERTFSRKLREIYLAAAVEERYSKDQILQAYLNTVYLGEGYYGVEAASRGYFGRPALDLEPAQAALLAALIKSPSTLAPRRAPARARARRALVLRVMRERGQLDADAYRRAAGSPLVLQPRRRPEEHAHPGETLCALHFRQEVRAQLLAIVGGARLYRGGLRVYTTLDPDLQLAAEQAIAGRLEALDRPTRSSEQSLEAALVTIDPRNGHVLAMVGGRDFHRSRFNRATRARRQPGSAFKPLIFAAALERGYTPATVLDDLDTPIHLADGSWIPDGQHEAGRYTLRRALVLSSNRAAARLLDRLGPSAAIDLSHRLGIASDLPAVPSLALGTGEVTLLELTSAYGTFANGGVHASPVMITRIEDADGGTIWRHGARTQQAIRPSTAFLISDILADAIDRGTGSTVRSRGFELRAAGKTGTTNEYADAWFVGYTPTLVTGVWVGYDLPTTIARRGFASVIAAPLWASFMKVATRGDESDWFAPPSDVERITVCRTSGARAGSACREAADTERVVWETSDTGTLLYRVIPAAELATEYFAVGTAPWATCRMHTDVALLSPVGSSW